MGRKQPYLPAAQNNSKVLHICPYALTSMHNFRVKGSYLENYVCASTPNLGEWAERWDSRFAPYWCQHPPKFINSCETQRSAHSPRLGVDAHT